MSERDGPHPVRTRLFVAVNLPVALRGELGRAVAPLRNEFARAVAWVAPAQLHVTLRFLGEQSDRRIPAIAGALGAAAAGVAPADLVLAGAGGFPTAVRPRVLWAGLRPNAALAALYHEVDAVCGRLGLPREQRAFHPHVTLGRVRPGGTVPADLVVRLERALPELSSLPMRTVDLMASRLSAGGARYTLVAAHPLGGVPAEAS